MNDTTTRLFEWPIAEINTHERLDHSSGEPLPTSYGEAEYLRGWTDGRLGVRAPTAAAVYRFRAGQWCSAYHVELVQRLEAVKATRDNARDRAERAREDADRVGEAFLAADRHRLESPTSYSWPLGVLYCVVAVVLWIADLPLSLLAADGLDIRTNYGALANLETIRVNWTSMWEPLAFAIGIAALGLFFKFVADFFFKPRLHQNLAMKILSAVLVIGLIALVTWNLYYLAQLRTGIKSLHEAMRTSANGTPADVQGLTATMQTQAGMSFILLTLTLPIIGGICASVGWNRIQNTNRYRVLKNNRRELRATADELADTQRSAEAVVRTIENEVASVRQLDPEMVAQAALDLYEQGFVRGRLVPETVHNGRRLHERAQFVVKRFLGISERRFSESVSNVPEVAPQR